MKEDNITSELKALKETNKNYLRLINVLLEDNKKLRNDLTNYELIKAIMNDDGNKPLIRPREEELEEKTKIQKYCFLCKRDDLDLSELPWQIKGKYYACDSCREEIEEDNRKVQESRLKTREYNGGGRKVRVNNEEALKHTKPSKKKGKSICLECNKEFLTQYFHSHYVKHIK